MLAFTVSILILLLLFDALPDLTLIWVTPLLLLLKLLLLVLGLAELTILVFDPSIFLSAEVTKGVPYKLIPSQKSLYKLLNLATFSRIS